LESISGKIHIIHKPSHASRLPNGTYIKNKRLEGLEDGALASLSEYNPHLLPLNEDLGASLFNYFTGKYHPDMSDQEADEATYLH